MRNIQLLIGCLIFAGASCREELTPTPYTYTQVFTGVTSKTWKVKFIELAIDGEAEDTFTLSCDPDHLYTFQANPERGFKVTAGANRCSADEPDVINDTWSYNSATATLTMILPFFNDTGLPFIVREARKNKMELEIFLDQENTTSYRIHFEPTDED